MDLQADVLASPSAPRWRSWILMATGWHTSGVAARRRRAAGMLEFGVSRVLQRIDLLGLAVFVLVAGPGRWSADHETGSDAVLRPALAALWPWRGLREARGHPRGAAEAATASRPSWSAEEPALRGRWPS